MTMKYFTAERWVRFQNSSDKQVFYSAHEDWEQAIAAYRKKLSQILSRLPIQLKRFAESECLHDAMIVTMWQSRNRFHILLRPDGPTEELIQLTYTLAAPVRVKPAALTAEYRTTHAAWLYDEIGIAKRNTDKAVFNHSILLSNGWEITIHFTRFGYSRHKPLLVSSDKDSAFALSRLPRPA